MRRAFALALLAVSFLVFQPICAADAAHLYDDADSACLSIGPAAPAHLEGSASIEQPRAAIPIAAAVLLVAGTHAVFSGALARAGPLPVPRYYARSARIQR